MCTKELISKLEMLTKQPRESEWFEFKQNFHSPDEIGENISALSNSAKLKGEPYAYLVFGVNDASHAITGTTFRGKSCKVKNQELESWLSTRLNPRIDFAIYEFDYADSIHITLFEIPAAKHQPVEFLHKPYIRVGSTNRFLSDFPEKAAKIWQKSAPEFEVSNAMQGLQENEIPGLLDTQLYFDLLRLPIPSDREGILQRFLSEKLIVEERGGYAITNLGAILFAKNLADFDLLNRKAVRVIVYKGKNKVETERERIWSKGYALVFADLIEWVNSQLPANEEIGKVLRQEKRMFPEIAIRELVVNALLHQDFTEAGFPVIEIYSDRLEISNAGIPLIKPDRFIDAYSTRNERLADLMRRLGFCEEKGSGFDKVISGIELYQLPPFNISITSNRTTVSLYRYKKLSEMDKNDRIRACYQQACLRYVSNEKMTNQSLRERFSISEKNYTTATRIINDTLAAGLIKIDNPENTSRKFIGYIPYWA